MYLAWDLKDGELMKIVRHAGRWMSVGLWLLITAPAFSQQPAVPETPTDPETPATPQKVDVKPVATDVDIAARLKRILEATGWFQDPSVRVDEGVVFLAGGVDTLQHKEWAGKLATNTQDVVAVVNQLEVAETSMWDLSPAWRELRELGAQTVRKSPLIAVGLLCLVATWAATRWTARGVAWLLRDRMESPLLSDVVARAAAVPVFLLGLYLILRISGLTRLAVTVLGGTGLVALVIGFAFRDIAENFLASILISIQHPFARGDLIQVAGYQGYVQSVNPRSALLMTLEGNHVQIPNATIYKETIINFTANPNARFDFLIGIGYADSVTASQEVALKVLQQHPAVVADPEPLVLVESLGAATVNLRIYFWIDIARYSALKVRSAVIRLTKRAFEQAGISMPDDAREVVFPAGVPVSMVSDAEIRPVEPPAPKPSEKDDEAAAHAAEGDLASEATDIEEQARHSRNPEKGQDLLKS